MGERGGVGESKTNKQRLDAPTLVPPARLAGLDEPDDPPRHVLLPQDENRRMNSGHMGETGCDIWGKGGRAGECKKRRTCSLISMAVFESVHALAITPSTASEGFSS